VTHKKDILKAQNPHFLHSLFNRKAGDYRIDIDPGIECPVTGGEVRSICKMMKRNYGITMEDSKPHNMGFIPGTHPRYPVFIDLDPHYVKISGPAVSRLTAAVRSVKEILTGKEDKAAADIQDKIYAPLKAALNEAWPANQDTADTEGIDRFFQLCREFKEAGKLVAGWEDEKNSYSNTTETSRRYAQRLQNSALGYNV